MSRLVYIILGHFFLALASIGALLPLLPTVPFLLLSAFFYSKGSQKFHSWLINHRKFGPLLLLWNSYGVIPNKAKYLALAIIIINLFYIHIYSSIPKTLKWTSSIVLMIVFIFVSSRPGQIPKR